MINMQVVVKSYVCEGSDGHVLDFWILFIVKCVVE